MHLYHLDWWFTKKNKKQEKNIAFDEKRRLVSMERWLKTAHVKNVSLCRLEYKFTLILTLSYPVETALWNKKIYEKFKISSLACDGQVQCQFGSVCSTELLDNLFSFIPCSQNSVANFQMEVQAWFFTIIEWMEYILKLAKTP